MGCMDTASQQTLSAASLAITSVTASLIKSRVRWGGRRPRGLPPSGVIRQVEARQRAAARPSVFSMLLKANGPSSSGRRPLLRCRLTYAC